MSHNTLTTPTPEETQADFDAWSAELADTSASNEVLPTEKAAIEAARNRLVEAPSATVETQVNRVANVITESSEKASEPAETTEAGYSTRSARYAQSTANRLSSVAETLEAEGSKGLAKAALRRIGRAATAPLRLAASATKNKVGAFFEAGNQKFDAFLKAGEARFAPVAETSSINEQIEETDPSADEEAQVEDTNDDDEPAIRNKRSARVISNLAHLVDSDDSDSRRRKISDKVYDFSDKVEGRDGTYASRGAEKVRNNLDKFDKWSNENEGWLKNKIQEKARDAKERRANRIKKQRLRTIGRKVLAYHRAGKEAAKNI